MNTIKSLRVVGFLEGLSFLVLLTVCMPLKYLKNIPEPTTYIGMLHGLLFMLYVLLVLIVGVRKDWSYNLIFYLLIASILPCGTFVAEYKVFKNL